MARKEKEPEAADIGRRVRLARQGRRMTLEKLAEDAETSVQFLSQLEKGEQSMTMVKFGRVAKALRVSSDYLLFGREGLEEPVALAVEFIRELSPVRQELLAQMIIDLQRTLDVLRPENEQ